MDSSALLPTLSSVHPTTNPSKPAARFFSFTRRQHGSYRVTEAAASLSAGLHHRNFHRRQQNVERVSHDTTNCCCTRASVERLIHTGSWRAVYMSVITCNLLLALIEPSSLRTTDNAADLPGEQKAILVVEMLFIAFYGLDIWMRWFAGEDIYRDLWLRCRVAAMVCIFINLSACLISSVGLKNFSRLLRPLLFIERLRNVRKIASSVLSILPKVIQILLLLTFWVVFFGVAGFTLFAGVVGPIDHFNETTGSITTTGCAFLRGGISYVQGMPERLRQENRTFFACSTFGKVYPNGAPCLNYFDTIWTSMMHLFTLLTTANYPDVMMPMYDCSQWSAIFFVLFITVGLYFLLSLILAVVYTHFAARNALVSERMEQKKMESLTHAFQLMHELTLNEKKEEEDTWQKKEEKEKQEKQEGRQEVHENRSEKDNDGDNDGENTGETKETKEGQSHRGEDDIENTMHTTPATASRTTAAATQSSSPSTSGTRRDSVAVQFARENLARGSINRSEFVQILAADAAKESLDQEFKNNGSASVFGTTHAAPTGMISRNVWRNVVQEYRPQLPVEIVEALFAMHVHNFDEAGTMSFLQFLQAVAHTRLRIRIKKQLPKRATLNNNRGGRRGSVLERAEISMTDCRQRTRQMLRHRFYEFGMDVLICINTLFMLLRLSPGALSTKASQAIGVCMTILLFIFVLEICIKCYALSPKVFWEMSHFNKIDVVSIFGGVVALISTGDFTNAQEEEDTGALSDIFLLVRMIRMLRILRMNDAFRVISATIVEIAPALLRYIGVLAGLFYCFAVIGMECFAGLLSRRCLPILFESMVDCEVRTYRLEHSR